MCACWNCTWNPCALKLYLKCVSSNCTWNCKCVYWSCTWNVCVETALGMYVCVLKLYVEVCVCVCVLKLHLKCMCVCWNCMLKCVCWNCTWNVCVETALEMCVCVCVETAPEMCVLKLCWNVCVCVCVCVEIFNPSIFKSNKCLKIDELNIKHRWTLRRQSGHTRTYEAPSEIGTL